jgi:predicted enzyme related to lactoylglutathione lyase
MFTQFSHVMIYVNDVARAMGWYRDVLGFSVHFDVAPHYASLWHDELKFRLDLHPDRTGQNVGRGAEIYFRTDNLADGLAALAAKGVKVTEPRSEDGGSVWFAHCIDSEGNRVGIWEKRTTP